MKQVPSDMENDLSHVFTGDPDEGQENHGNLPDEMRKHIFRGFAHAAGIAPNPGPYKGPSIPTPPADWNTPQEPSQQEQQELSAIKNISEKSAPIIPAPKMAQGSKTIPKNAPPMD